jgi:hypothetical protein
MGLVKRRLYKPERAPARKKGVLNSQAPVSCIDAGSFEIAAAIAAFCRQAKVIPGQGGEYDWLKDEYTIIGKSRVTGKAQDFKIKGDEVGALIKLARSINGGRPMYRQGEKNTAVPTYLR